MPSFGTNTKPAKVTCRYDGEESSVTTQPLNLTLVAINQKAQNAKDAVGGILGLLAADIVAETNKQERDPSDDKWGYQNVHIGFGNDTDGS